MLKKVFMVLGMVAIMTINSGKADEKGAASFAEFDRKAKAGESLNVVFFGGSLTWSANATEPNITGFRGQMAKFLTRKYPAAHFTFHDAAIGGTGSMLGIFRLDRDVLAKKPDLVFLDFSCNDNCGNTELPQTCCYESLLRRMIKAGVAVEQVYFSFKFLWDKDKTYDQTFPRRAVYKQLAAAYNTPYGDAYGPIKAALDSGKTLDDIWPIDGGHPDDLGYALFAQAAQEAFDQAVKAKTVCKVPAKPVFGDVKNLRRLRLADGKLPQNWRRVLTYRTSAWYDGLTSRWMGDVACFSGAQATPLNLQAAGNFIAFFGEGDPVGFSYNLGVAGKEVAKFSHKIAAGRLFAFRSWLAKDWQTNAYGKPQAITVTPLIDAKTPKAELRIESLLSCSIVPVKAVKDGGNGGDSQAELEKLDHGRGK